MGGTVKKVLVTSNGDEISRNIAYHLVQRGCRFALNLILPLSFFSAYSTFFYLEGHRGKAEISKQF